MASGALTYRTAFCIIEAYRTAGKGRKKMGSRIVSIVKDKRNDKEGIIAEALECIKRYRISNFQYAHIKHLATEWADDVILLYSPEALADEKMEIARADMTSRAHWLREFLYGVLTGHFGGASYEECGEMELYFYCIAYYYKTESDEIRELIRSMDAEAIKISKQAFEENVRRGM